MIIIHSKNVTLPIDKFNYIMYNIGVFCFVGGKRGMTSCMCCCKLNISCSSSQPCCIHYGKTAQNNCDSLTAQK